jgi:carboxypeptidase Q
MTGKKALPVFLALLISSTAAASEAVSTLVARALGPSPMIEDVKDLCDRIGGRPTGSAACERAVDWAVARFRKAGLETSAEPFSIPNLWLPGTADASCTQPAPFLIRLAAAPFSPSTQGVLEARLVDAGDGSADAFGRLGESAKGAIALVHTNEMKTLDDLFTEYVRNMPLLDAAVKAGVAALLLESTRLRGLLYRHPVSFDGSPVKIPAAIVSREHAGRLARLLENGEVRIRLELSNKMGGAYESRNVVAEIRGREKPDEIVLLGAHLDSWDLGTGAEDNGVNVAMVLDVARGFKELALRPRRTVRFVLFTGEEQGMWGSRRYVERHRAEMDRHKIMITFDSGSGRTTGFFLNGRADLRDPLNKALAAVSGFGAFDHTVDGIDGTDNFDFMLSGVPNLVANQDVTAYLPEYHAESDTFERVNAREQQVNEAIASALLWNFADGAELPARQKNREEVEQMLTRIELDAQLKAFGQWEDFKGGRRGVF